MLTELNHLTINVVDLEESVHFYGELLGLKRLNSIDMGDHELYYFQLPGGCRLELIHYLTAVPKLHPESNTLGLYRHFCLKSDNITELYQQMRKEKIVITKELGWVEKLGCSTMLVLDPNGVEIEFID